ncbi:MAG: copper chaperone PCu(A)C [Rhodospirillales bacterium]|nr:copper chaperone PCu(A)C [Rhodospirillales bacterium]MCW9040724.1 copper chaperone PCu(A)C [Rhodospirillales bacterium]
MIRFLSIIAIAITVTFASPASAGDIMVKDPWARASAGMARAGAAFMVLMNKSGAADQLVDAKADISAKVELHTHIMEEGVMKMRQVPAIDVPANGMAALQPGGDHVMFMGLNAPLKEGDTFPLTLVFKNAGEVTVDVTVKTAGAMGAGSTKMHMKH